MKEKIILEIGDICRQKTEAIVNAANTNLLHGGGLAAAVVAAGGDIIQEESTVLAPIPIGEAAVTKGGKLKAGYVIHAATMKLGDRASAKSVSDCVNNSLRRAEELGIKTIAFPALGAGIGGLPIEKCAIISLQQSLNFLLSHPGFEKIVFVLHSKSDYETFSDNLSHLADQK